MAALRPAFLGPHDALFSAAFAWAPPQSFDVCVELAHARGEDESVAVHDDDAHDIRGSLDGDEHAYARLVQRYEALVGKQMWRYSRDPRVAEELVQEVFVEAYVSLKGFRGRAPFEHWLRRIATRVGYRHWRRSARRREREQSLEAMTVPPIPKVANTSPSEAGEYLHTLLQHLPPRDRLVLTLQYFEECSTEEIADRTGWSRSLVKVQAFRARKKLKTMLEEAGYRKKNDA